MLDKKNLTIGEMAKYLNVSVRTLQYYDKIGLMKPSKISEGGRRIYEPKDITTLHQIITLKSLGFSLDDIKNKLIKVNNNEDIVTLLDKQQEMVIREINNLKKTLESIEVLKSEIEEKQQVDWYKYLNMVKLIQENSEFYWVVNHLDNKLISYISEQKNVGEATPGWWREIFLRAIKLKELGVNPDSEEGQSLAYDWWVEMEKYSNGDSEIIDKMLDFYNSADQWPEEFKTLQKEAQDFMEKAFLNYTMKNNLNIHIKGDE